MAGRVLLLLLLLLCLGSTPTLAQAKPDRKRQKLLEKLSKRLGIPVEELDRVQAERLASPRPEDRRELLLEVGRHPRGPLLPLVLEAAQREPDFPARVAAVRLLSVVGLETDRRDWLERLLPALLAMWSDPEDDVFLRAADETLLLARWFEVDAPLAAPLERAFRGENYRLAQKAFFGLIELREPTLRQGPGLRALSEVLAPKTRFSVFERKRAVQEVGRRGGPATPAQLAQLLFEDGTVAIECAEALGALGDPSVLPQLRRVDRTASHALRLPVYRVRARLGDAGLLADLEHALANDHEAVQRVLIEGLGLLPDPTAGKALERLSGRVQGDALRREVALARLTRGDAQDLAPLREALEGDAPDLALAKRVLALETRAAAPLIELLARNPKAGARRDEAVDRLGAWGLGSEEDLALLRELDQGPPAALRLRAAASLLQLGTEDGVARIHSALKDLDVVSREDVDLGLGSDQPKARRYRGSPLVDVCRRLARSGTRAALPVLSSWLEPPAQRAPAPAPGPGAGSRTRPAPAPPASPRPEPPAWLRHPFVRAGVVAALGELARAIASGAEAKPAAAELARARRALAWALDDPAGVVQREAVRGLAAWSGVGELEPGASLEREAELAERVRGWLATADGAGQ